MQEVEAEVQEVAAEGNGEEIEWRQPLANNFTSPDAEQKVQIIQPTKLRSSKPFQVVEDGEDSDPIFTSQMSSAQEYH